MKLKRDYPNSATGVEFFRKIFKFKKSKRDWSRGMFTLSIKRETREFSSQSCSDVQFVVRSLLCFERFFSGYSGFPLYVDVLPANRSFFLSFFLYLRQRNVKKSYVNVLPANRSFFLSFFIYGKEMLKKARYTC